jgi:hypothetical protein
MCFKFKRAIADVRPCTSRAHLVSSSSPSPTASVFSAKKTEWFTFFFVPILPFSSKHVWLCHICRWMAPHAPGSVSRALRRDILRLLISFSQWEPTVAYAGGGFPPAMQPNY